MDAELKAKWIAALRSGEYEQGRVALLREGKYCCLGVLCVIMGDAPPEHTPEVSMKHWYDMMKKEMGDENISALYYRNDGLGAFNRQSFAEIADYIEANL